MRRLDPASGSLGSASGPAGVLWALSRPATAADRLRSRMISWATAGCGAFLLAALVVLRASATEGPHFQRTGDGTAETYPDLVSFVQDPATSLGTAFGVALLVIPFLLFGVQALRSGTAARERRLAALSLAGATRGQLRRVAVLEGARAAVLGGVLAGPAYLVLWLIVGRLLPHGQRILPDPDRVVLAAWVLMVIVLTMAGAVAAGACAGPATVSPLGLTRRAPRLLGPLSALLPLLSLVVAAACFAIVRTGRAEVPGMCLLIASAVLAAITAGPWVIVLTGRLALRQRSVAATLAGHRLLADPRTPGRVVGVFFAAGGVVAVVVLQSGWAAVVLGGGERVADEVAVRVGLGAALGAGILAMVVAAASLVAGATEQVVDGRRGTAILVALAASPAFVASVVRRQLLLTVMPGAVLGTITGWAIMSAMVRDELPPGGAAMDLVSALALSGVASALVALAATALVRPVVREVCAPGGLRAP